MCLPGEKITAICKDFPCDATKLARAAEVRVMAAYGYPVRGMIIA